MDPVRAYLVDATLPADSKEADRVKKKANWFILYDRVLYKHSYTCPLLRYVTPEMGQKVLEEIHEGVSSAHIRGCALVVTAMQTVYISPLYTKML